MRTARRLLAVGLSVALAGVFASGAGAAIYKSTSSVDTDQMADDSGKGNPYPSTITVGGLPAPLLDVKAGLGCRGICLPEFGASGFTHEYPQDMDMLLVGPGGQKVMLMSDACGIPPTAGNLDITFDDVGPVLPGATPCASATYMPADYPPADTFPAPAPAGPYGTSMAVFNGASGEGPWQLFVFDDTIGDSGHIGRGWALELLPSVSCMGRPATVAAHAGDNEADFLRGTSGPDILVALGGVDTVEGMGGNDLICGGAGADELKGGAGNDIILGAGGKDKLKGQGGRDKCTGGAGKDTARSCEKRKTI